MSELDAELVERTLSGDRPAFEALIAAHLPRAQAVAWATLGNRSAVDDVVQDAFLRAYERLGQLTDPSTFPAWLATIVRNEAASWHRRVSRRRQVALTENTPSPPPDSGDEASDHSQLRQALSRLSADYREILTLKYEAGCSYDKIAETLGTSVANVEKRLYRARQALIKLIGNPELH
jgi:RNA polymerase sigma-70 factor, ECF subfamily